MRKRMTLLCLLFVALMSTGCGNRAAEGETTVSEERIETASATAETEEETVSSESSVMEASSEAVTEPIEETKALVAYFSCTGNTNQVAEKIAEGTGADLYEIIPVDPYTAADLDYHDDKSRSTIEMNDISVRPEIAGPQVDMESYDTVYIGYPIWWGEAPRILDTFVESYDFDGKKVVPFCTSGGSGVGSSDDRLKELAGSGTWTEGRKLSPSDSLESIMDWVNGL